MSSRYRTGRDGKKVTIPAGYSSREGRDGRVVAIPIGGTSREGHDGRVAAIKRGAPLVKVGMVASFVSLKDIPRERGVTVE